MRWTATFVAGLAGVAWSVVVAAAGPSVVNPYTAPGAVVVLSYHEVRDDVRDYPDPLAVDTASLVRQFAWLRGNGYTPVSLDAIVAARESGPPLPPKAVLLTFDDAYLSFYTRVYPLLRAFRFPAVLAVVGRWIDDPGDSSVLYGERSTVSNATFVTWSHIREMAASGLVEIASHTYDLHRGVTANPQGNVQPAATARVYDSATGQYEGDAPWRERVRADLARNSNVIERETGRRPRTVVWPYGSYNDELVRLAGELGMSIALTLDDGAHTPEVPLTAVRRTLIEHNPNLADFTTEVRGPLYPNPVRAVQVALDSIYSAEPAQQERNLSALLDRIQVLQPTHVYLQATADTDNDGLADAAYFPNRHLPLRADLFNRVAWQVTSRTRVKVFAVLPVAGLRLSPDEVVEVYEDLARHASFDGLLFMQDGTPDIAAFLASTQRLADAAGRWRGPARIARGFTVDSSRADQDLAQHVAALAAGSDVVVVTTPPDHVGASETRGLAPGRAVLFLLSHRAGSDRHSGDRLARRMRALQLAGQLNFGYRGDDVMRDDPALAQVAPAMSLRIHPR